MAWRRTRTRPLWRTLVDALVFAAALIIVALVLDRLGLTDIGSGGYTVVDGDSLRRGDTEIRLVGIDAPEYRQMCRDRSGQEYACGREALTALRALVRSGTVTCESHDVDRYGRALSSCRVNGENINREMVRSGWAVAYTPAGLDFSYMREEREAKAARRGVWQGPFERPSDYRARNRVTEGNLAGVAAADD